MGLSNTRPGHGAPDLDRADHGAHGQSDQGRVREPQGPGDALRAAGSPRTAGSVAEGERVIEVLRQIKATHQLETVVAQGDVCASMCVFIYVQGQKRFGATDQQLAVPRGLAHGPRHQADRPSSIAPPGSAWSTSTCGRPACPDAWIADLKPRTVDSDYWQTGSDLINSNSGIIHEPLGNQIRPLRRAEPRSEGSRQRAASGGRQLGSRECRASTSPASAPW